ncbi:MAG TPA: hypothetical protein VIY86_12665 [Pirellulaceae bacterium]
MFRRLMWGGGILAAVATFFFGWDAMSYVRTGAGVIRDGVRDSVPVRFEFQRARTMIEALDPEIRKNMMLIAKEEVEIERLENQVERLSTSVDRDRSQLTRLTRDVQEGQFHFVYGGRRYTEQQVKADLANRLKRVKTNDTTLESLRTVLIARENRLDAARQKLEQTLALKRQAVVEVENLEARQKMVEVAHTTTALAEAFDDSVMSRTRELIDDLATRVEVAERMIDSEGELVEDIDMEEEVSTDILEEVASYLHAGDPEVTSVADLRE